MSLVFLAAAALVGAPAAGALPKGAYWYAQLDLQRAWKITEGAGVTVAVIDGGVQADLGDLRGQVLPGLDLTGQDPEAQHEPPRTAASKFGHGSDMAALIAGTGKGAGLRGVAPQAKILPIDVVTSSGYIDDTLIAKGITWAVDHHAQVVNVSLGAANPCNPVIAPTLKYAYQHNVLVLVSAGDQAGPVSSPANCPGALAIGGIDSANKPWVNSASGPQTAFVAPAYGLVNELLNNTLNGPNAYNSGTSQATAIAAGTFALLRARFPSESARQIVTRALYNVHNGLGTGKFGQRASDALGYGLVLPNFALTEAPPAGAKNPIFDQWAKDFGASTGGSPSSSASAAPSDSGSSPPAGSAPASSTAAATSNDSSGGGLSPVLIVVIVVVVIGVVVAVVAAVRRRNRPAAGPPPPPGYGR